MRKLAAAVIAALFACQCFALAPARAGTTGVLAGRIVDSTSRLPLAHAKVAVASPSQSAATETDAGGSFRFLSLAPDTYVLSVTLEGYDTVSQPAVTVQADQSETVDVTLQKTLRTIGKVTRRASGDLIRPGVTSDVYSVNAAAQEAAVGLGGAGGLNSAYGAIASVPGTVVQAAQQGWYQTISIRGGDIDQVGYELDGIPVNRVYDNAPQTMLSSLGQQELQVYTGGTPAGSDGQGLSGYVNQVIKSGTYPGFGTLNASIGGPAFYHKLSFETGGASPNRNFSYYIGLAGANEDYRYVDNFNGASDPRLFYPLYWPEGRYNLYDGTPNSDGTPGTVQFAPGVTYAISNTSQRDTVANFHFALPHKNDGLKDDVQLLYVTSEIVADYFSSINDQGGPAAVANAVGGSGNASWHDGYVYNGPLFSAPDPAQVVPYYFMSSPTNRALNSPYSNDARDTNDNGVATLKLQYQKNFSSRSFARISAYSLYSNWFIHGAANQNFTGYYGAELNDYEIPSHTFGGNFTYSNQLSDKHLLTLTGAYSTTTIQRRYNYGFPGNQTLDTAFTNLIDPATAATTGHCYDTTGALTSCFNGPRGTFADPYDGTSAGFTVATPTGGTAQWIATENGPLGRVNNVSPITTALSLTDNVRASDKVTLNLGVRLENYTDRLADTSGGPNRAFWVKAYNNEFCYRPGVFGAIDIAGSATPDPVTGVFATAANCAALGTGYVPVNFINSNGDGKISSTVTQPRLAFTFAPDGDTVIRGSFGVYSRPVNTSWLQYNDLNDRDWLLYAGSNFAGYGFNTPRHDLQPDTSFNYDLSLEKHLKGTDFSFKATPFYRHTKNQLQAFPIGIGGIVSGFNVGQQTSSGIELALRKGDFARDGLAAQSVIHLHSQPHQVLEVSLGYERDRFAQRVHPRVQLLHEGVRDDHGGQLGALRPGAGNHEPERSGELRRERRRNGRQSLLQSDGTAADGSQRLVHDLRSDPAGLRRSERL